MSIPLDRLYNHIDKLSQRFCEDSLVIYRFFPHGSKNLKDLVALKFALDSKNWPEWQMSPFMICHDQEPLNYDLYTKDLIKSYTEEKYINANNSEHLVDIVSNMHLRSTIYYPTSCYDHVMLTHSEKNSKNLAQYENNGFLGVYWWSHAVISRDWFRYAEDIVQQKQVSKTFLIYNRAWSGTREYRLKFFEFLIAHNLVEHCQTTMNAIEPELNIHYSQHTFENNLWKPTCQLEEYYDKNLATSSCSADFVLDDYENTDIEVVLETLFDDPRLHLTEKTLRPIALGQPFILAATSGSLQYLRDYGFQTFDTVWSEDYDQIVLAKDRLEAVAKLIKSISLWSPEVRQQKMNQARDIANYNKQLFFSKSWGNRILQEYQENFESAWETMKKNRTGKYFFELREKAKPNTTLSKQLESDNQFRTKEEVQRVLNWLILSGPA